jgi:membrane protease YdiL (CAAX protease family)
MSTEFTDERPPPPPPRRGRPLIAWLVIAAAVGFVLFRNYSTPSGGAGASEDAIELQGRSLVGEVEIRLASGAAMYQQAQALNRGPTAQRLRFVVLAGELKGPQEALNQLDALQKAWDEEGLKRSDEEEKTAEVLRKLYVDYRNGDKEAPHVTDEERRWLHDRLGWFGDLALAPGGGPDPAARAAVLESARRAATASLAVIGAVGFLCFAAVILFFLLIVFWRRLRSYFRAGSPHGGVYGETFALWMVLFLGLGYLTSFVSVGPPHSLALAGLAHLASLAALAWPVWCGIPWRQVRWEVGLDLGRRPPLEPLCGVACYVAAVPLVVLAALFVVVAMQVQQRLGWQPDRGPLAPPGHPATKLALQSDWWGRLLLLLVASVQAPLVEETMFRGVLYRHLRDASVRLGRGMSILLSALAASFVFAVIHPQGLFGVPVLMALACGFAAAREWRNSLVGPMTAHALHNAAVLGLTITLGG